MRWVSGAAAFAAFLAVGVDAKKPKQKSEFVELKEVQEAWKGFFKETAVRVADGCSDCDWQGMVEQEVKLATQTQDLLTRKPEFSASLSEMIRYSPNLGVVQKEGDCQAASASNRDDLCTCARAWGTWEFDCVGLDGPECRKFLGGVCGLEVPGGDEDLDSFEDLQDLEQRLKVKQQQASADAEAKAAVGQVKKEAGVPEAHHRLVQLELMLKSLEKERTSMQEVHATHTKDNPRPLLASLDARIEKQKTKIVEEMEELLRARKEEVEKRKQFHENAEREYKHRAEAALMPKEGSLRPNLREKL